MTAVERFKAMLADAMERICVLEEQLELRDAKIAELEQQLAAEGEDKPPQ